VLGAGEGLIVAAIRPFVGEKGLVAAAIRRIVVEFEIPVLVRMSKSELGYVELSVQPEFVKAPWWSHLDEADCCEACPRTAEVFRIVFDFCYYFPQRSTMSSSPHRQVELQEPPGA
jgi:hypothetical protein